MCDTAHEASGMARNVCVGEGTGGCRRAINNKEGIMMKWIKGSVVVCAVVAVLGVGSQASAGKGEGPPPGGFKDSGPAAVGSLTFQNGSNVAVAVTCKGQSIDLSFPSSYDLQTLTEADIEGFSVAIQGIPPITAEMIHCYPDLVGSPNLQMVVNTVTKFKAIPATGPRSTVIADVVLMRRTLK